MKPGRKGSLNYNKSLKKLIESFLKLNEDDYADKYEKIIRGFIMNLNRFMKREWETENYKEKLEKLIQSFEIGAASLYKGRREE